MIYDIFPSPSKHIKNLESTIGCWDESLPWAFHCFLHRRTPRTAPRRRRLTPKAPPLPKRRHLPRLRRRGRLRRRQRRPRWRGITHVTWHSWDDGDGRNLYGFWRVVFNIDFGVFWSCFMFFFSIELFFFQQLEQGEGCQKCGCCM